MIGTTYMKVQENITELDAAKLLAGIVRNSLDSKKCRSVIYDKLR